MRLILEPHPDLLFRKLGDVRRGSTSDHSDVLHLRITGATEDQLMRLLSRLIARIRIATPRRLLGQPTTRDRTWIGLKGELIGVPQDPEFENEVAREADEIYTHHHDTLTGIARAFATLGANESLVVDFDPQKLSFSEVRKVQRVGRGGFTQ
jgi:hypothetical protein